MSDKCIVHGCPNYPHQGGFNGVLCTPCHHMITRADVRYGETFVHKMHDLNEELEAKLAKVVDALKFYAYVDDDQGYRARTVLEEIGEKSDE